MIRRVVIPLDGSELAERVIPHLLRFITPQQTELLLLMTALSSPQFPLLDDTIRSLESTADAMFQKGEMSPRVQVVAQQLSQQGFRVESKFVNGMPAESILHVAEQTGVDLIAMSTHGRTGIGLALLGSVADEVVRNALPPVFLVPAQAIIKPDSLPQTLLLPLDGTSLAEMAIPTARHVAQITGAKIHLLRVVEPLDSEGVPSTGCVFVDPEDAREHPVAQQAACYLGRIHDRLQLVGIASHWRIAMGDPAIAIAFAADFDNADLIVMSTHGRAGMERMVFGSIASQVIGNAICPVLLMRGKVPVEEYQCNGDVAPANLSG